MNKETILGQNLVKDYKGIAIATALSTFIMLVAYWVVLSNFSVLINPDFSQAVAQVISAGTICVLVIVLYLTARKVDALEKRCEGLESRVDKIGTLDG